MTDTATTRSPAVPGPPDSSFLPPEGEDRSPNQPSGPEYRGGVTETAWVRPSLDELVDVIERHEFLDHVRTLFLLVAAAADDEGIVKPFNATRCAELMGLGDKAGRETVRRLLRKFEALELLDYRSGSGRIPGQITLLVGLVEARDGGGVRAPALTREAREARDPACSVRAPALTREAREARDPACSVRAPAPRPDLDRVAHTKEELPLVGKEPVVDVVVAEGDLQPEQQHHQDARRAQLLDRLIAEGVTPGRADGLVRRRPPEVVQRQLACLDDRRARDRAAVLVRSIEEDWAPPRQVEARPPTFAEIAADPDRYGIPA